MTHLLALLHARWALAQRAPTINLASALTPAGVTLGPIFFGSAGFAKACRIRPCRVNMLIQRLMAHWQFAYNLLWTPLQGQERIRVIAEPKLHVFSGYGNAMETGGFPDISFFSKGINKWFSSDFLVAPYACENCILMAHQASAFRAIFRMTHFHRTCIFKPAVSLHVRTGGRASAWVSTHGSTVVGVTTQFRALQGLLARLLGMVATASGIACHFAANRGLVASKQQGNLSLIVSGFHEGFNLASFNLA